MVRSRIAVFIVPGVLCYLGLAVVGAGGFVRFFSHPALWVVAIITILMLAAALFSEASLSRGEREDRANRWVLPAFGVVGVLSAFLPAWTDRIGFWTIDGETMRWFGAALFVVGAVLRLWAVFVLGSRFSGLVAIQPGHTLVTTGFYGIIRHPSYLGLLINALGWALAFRSGVGVLLVALTLVPLLARIRAEERLLSQEFGAAYETYCARTYRLVPGLY